MPIFGVLVIGEGAKILGPNEHGQEVLVIAEYLRLKHFSTIQVSQAVTKDFYRLATIEGPRDHCWLAACSAVSGRHRFHCAAA